MFVLHADADAFFASVEQRDDPRLRGRPVIVGGGVVLAASYEAKAFGIRTAMGGHEARRLCPKVVVVEPHMSAYSAASKAVFEVFDNTTPIVEPLSIDEAFLDVGGLRRIAGGRAVRRTRSGGDSRSPRTGTRRSKGPSTAAPGACDPPIGSGGRSRCDCGSTTSPASRVRTRCRKRPRRRTRSSLPRKNCW